MALVVEDGTGLDDADSYISVEDALEYHAAMGNEEWLDYTEEEQEIFLRRASRDLDILYGARYDSYLLSDEQALLWPRVAYRNTVGYYVSGLPLRIAQATAELALLEAQGNVLDPNPESMANVQNMSFSLGDLSSSTSFFAPGGAAPELNRVRLLLGPHISVGVSRYARVNRG